MQQYSSTGAHPGGVLGGYNPSINVEFTTYLGLLRIRILFESENPFRLETPSLNL